MLNGLMAVVTGGTAGIGRACAEALLADGAGGVLINGRNAERAEHARAAIQARFPEARVVLALGDVSEARTAEAVMAEATRRLGRIDVLVNSTGGSDLPRLLHRTPLVDIPGILERCLFAQILSCAAALPYMRQAGGGAVTSTSPPTRERSRRPARASSARPWRASSCSRERLPSKASATPFGPTS